MTKQEFDDLASSLKIVVAKEVAIIAELEGEAVGFSIPLLDINRILHKMDGNLLPFGWWKLLRGRKKLSHLRTALMGVLPEHQGKGIDAMLHQYVVEKGYENGYISSEIGWVLETNLDMIRVAERMGAKTFRMFETTL
jgi:GNAT superfamily N-acetyltransferase